MACLWEECNFSTLKQKNQKFNTKAEFVRTLEAKLAQHKEDMMTLPQDSEVLKVSSDSLKTSIQRLGDDLLNQKQLYQQ